MKLEIQLNTLNSDIKKLEILFNKPDTLLYVALSTLALDKNSIIPEMLYTLTEESITRLLSIYGGETIYIPTIEEFRKYLKSSICSYYNIVQKKSWKWIFEELQIPKEDQNWYKTKHYKWVEKAPSKEIAVLRGLKERGKVKL